MHPPSLGNNTPFSFGELPLPHPPSFLGGGRWLKAQAPPIRGAHIKQQGHGDRVLGSRAGRWGEDLPGEEASPSEGLVETGNKVLV